ncbi:Cruciform DNA binding protein [Cryptotrichosporon argae]
MVADKHYATFTWGVGPQTVHVAGGFNNWSDSATPLERQADGSFAAEVPMPWGAKQSFKYVVDGEWKVREDEAKEWAHPANLQIYTAPPAPLVPESAPAPASAAAAAAAPAAEPAPEPASEPAVVADRGPTEVPPATVPDAAPATETKTEPASLVAASAPGARSPPELGAIAAGGVAPSAPASVNPAAVAPAGPAATPAASGAAVGTGAGGASFEPAKTQAELIEQTAKTANVGEASVTEKTVYERAAEVGGVALAGLGAVAGTAAHAIEKVTGVDLTHANPLSVEEAKAKGIDIASLEKVDGPTDAITQAPHAPAAPPPASAVAALDEKIQELKIDTAASGGVIRAEQVDIPLPNGSAPKTSVAANLPEPKSATDAAHTPDIPAQADTKDNHRSVPATVITPVSARDSAKDRTLAAPADRDTAGNIAVGADPAADAVTAKHAAEADPAHTHPNATGPHTASVEPAGSTEPAVFAQSAVTPVSPPATSATATQPTPTGPATPVKAPASAASTPSNTPGHARESTGSTTGDVKKRKSGFFGKIKHAFSPAKEKK